MAYRHPNKVYVSGDTMWVAGSSSARDWLIDDPMIPFHGVHLSERYSQAMSQMRPGIRYIAGHSLGSAVAARIAEENPHLQARLYAAPRVSWNSNANDRIRSYRHPGDPISIADRGAQQVPYFGLNPHSFGGY